ncbi:DMT family transporter [Paenibacillus sp. 1001270B_150601_E10]|uniref:DMT family transporter n=1 Tax=Paenibacillus sp. 1001270B_150601_E10 TaxID=2787079 RepID=UPI00189EC184|nr:DMT family transporter [Paenibacillus sp. 1001270B_150601_E10]
MKAEQWFTHPVGLTVSAIVSTLLWGSAMPAIKIGYSELHIQSSQMFEQWVFAGYRFTLAGLMLVLFALLLEKKSNAQEPHAAASAKPLSTGRKWFLVARLASIQTLLQYLFFYIGLSLSTGMQGAIITGATSFFQMLVARFMDRSECFSANKTSGLILGFAGVAIVTFTQGGFHMQLGIGDVCLILSAFCGGFGNVLAKHEAKQLPVLWLTGRQMLLGGIVLTIIGAAKVGIAPFAWDASSLLLLLYLAFLSAAGFGLWNLIMKYNSVGKVSMFLFLIPVFGVFLSVLLLGEQFNEWILLALMLVAVGILVVNRTPKHVKKSQAAPSLNVTQP